MTLDDVNRFIDPLWIIPPREELDVFSDGDHVVAFSRAEWDFVVKILKEENDPGLLRRHEEALPLVDLVAPFRIIKENKQVIVVQEKIACFLDKRLMQHVQDGKLVEAKALVSDYIDFNLRLWHRGRFDWHFRINHCGLNASNQIVAFDIGGIRGRPDFKERVRWLFGYFGRKHNKNEEILGEIHPELANYYRKLARKKLTRRAAKKAIFSGEERCLQ